MLVCDMRSLDASSALPLIKEGKARRPPDRRGNPTCGPYVYMSVFMSGL